MTDATTNLVPVFRHTRQSIYKVVADLAQEQCLAIPTGFDNNIAWNLGHILTVHQRLCYLHVDLEPLMPREMLAMYVPGTSPAEWSTQPDCAELIAMVMDHLETFEADYATGRFPTTVADRTTSTGIVLHTFDELLMFNNYHEGLHYGTILSLLNFVAPDMKGP